MWTGLTVAVFVYMFSPAAGPIGSKYWINIILCHIQKWFWDVFSPGRSYSPRSFRVIKCRKGTKSMQMWPSLFHAGFQQPDAKFRRALHVVSLCNLSHHVVTSNLLITSLPRVLCFCLCQPNQSACVLPLHLWMQVCAHSLDANCRLSFIFYLVQAAAAQMHF